MTEEIIIDGVNVARCCFYNNGKCNNPNGMACNCINNAVCYFKELIRLKQQHNDDTEEIAKLGLDVAILEQENKQMESALKEIKQIIVINKDEFEHCLYHDYDEQILTKINEVLREDD